MKIAIGAVLALSVSLPVSAAGPVIIEGVWLTEKKSEMTIAPCPAGWCGYITKIVVPPEIKEKYGDDLAAIGDNYTDAMNPDPALRDRPILGLQILTLTATGRGKVFDGKIYNPENGKTYEGKLEVVNDNRVTLKGCVMFGMICQGEDWTRISGPPG
ncbi:MAG: DUF2147 domain-containing protein [Devosia sp.]